MNDFINGNVVGTFKIPEDIAHELSDLLVKQSVRERVLVQLADQPVKYEEAEKLIIPITKKIEAIKYSITNQYVPEQYRSSKYVWNYNGWEIDENNVSVIEV